MATDIETIRHEVILDTNVVLDWLLFDDPSGRVVGAAVMAGDVRWIGTADMLQELATVLLRPGLERWQHRVDMTLTTASANCAVVEKPWVVATATPRCSDLDDQKFIDLAVARRVRWLITRDKALLRLARPAHAFGVAVLTPSRWVSDCAAGSADETVPGRTIKTD